MGSGGKICAIFNHQNDMPKEKMVFAFLKENLRIDKKCSLSAPFNGIVSPLEK